MMTVSEAKPAAVATRVLPQVPAKAAPAPRRREAAAIAPMSEDGVSLYLQEIGRPHLLTADQEKVLGRRIEKGLALDEVRREARRGGTEPDALDLAATFVRRLLDSHHLILSAAHLSGIAIDGSFGEALVQGPLRRMLDLQPNAELAATLAPVAGETAEALEKHMVRLSVACIILPASILAMLDGILAAEQGNGKHDPNERLRKSLRQYASALDTRFRYLVGDADTARHELIEANLRLVVSVARRHLNRGVAFADLLQEGNIGLMHAATRFDYRKGFRFSTYATWWIQQAISRAIADQARTIRLPVHMVELLGKLNRVTRELAEELGRGPVREEVGLMMGFMNEKLEEQLARVATRRLHLANPADAGYDNRHLILRAGLLHEEGLLPLELRDKVHRSAAKIDEMLRAAQEPISLETPVGEGDESYLGDLIEDEQSVDPIDAASQHLLRVEVRQALDSLTERERQVLQLRFGLLDGQPSTLKEVGRELGITRERARQIESEALQKLRRAEMGLALREYLY